MGPPCQGCTSWGVLWVCAGKLGGEKSIPGRERGNLGGRRSFKASEECLRAERLVLRNVS